MLIAAKEVAPKEGIMSTSGYHGSPAAFRPFAIPHFPIAALAAINAMRSWHQHRRDEQELEGLPFDLRKDIGWPAADVTAATEPSTVKDA